MPLFNPDISSLPGPTIGFYGVAPVARPGPFVNTYSAMNWTLGAYTPNNQSSAYTGGLLDLLQAARLSDLNTLRTALENLRIMCENLAQQHNAIVADMKNLGLVS